jgi:hypothetical protein
MNVLSIRELLAEISHYLRLIDNGALFYTCKRLASLIYQIYGKQSIIWGRLSYLNSSSERKLLRKLLMSREIVHISGCTVRKNDEKLDIKADSPEGTIPKSAIKHRFIAKHNPHIYVVIPSLSKLIIEDNENIYRLVAPINSMPSNPQISSSFFAGKLFLPLNKPNWLSNIPLFFAMARIFML